MAAAAVKVETKMDTTAADIKPNVPGGNNNNVNRGGGGGGGRNRRQRKIYI